MVDDGSNDWWLPPELGFDCSQMKLIIYIIYKWMMGHGVWSRLLKEFLSWMVADVAEEGKDGTARG
jgi:hypothetical protein